MRVGGDRRHHERDEAHVHRVERPAHAGGDKQAAVRLVERQAVQALIARERGAFAVNGFRFYTWGRCAGNGSGGDFGSRHHNLQGETAGECQS